MVTQYLPVKTPGNSFAIHVANAGPFFYVSPSGNDSNNGSIGSPFATVAKGVSVLTPGATLYLRAGTYPEALAANAIPGGTSWAKPVTVSAYPGETAILQPPAGSARCLTFSSSASQYIQVIGLVLDAINCGFDCVKITDSSGGGGTTAHHI